MTKPAASHPPRPAAAWRAPLRTSGLLSVLALCVASPLAVLSLLGVSTAAGQPHAFGVPPGVSDDGRLLPADVATATAGGAVAAPPHGLQLRRGCRWGQPGRAPYRGSTRQALQAAGLPEDVVAQIEAQRNAGRKSGRLAISREGIRHTGDGRVFPARGFALTFGMTLCQDASVNFAKDHVEMADLYEARDAQGRLHAVMVPDVCGNVSVLGMRGQGTVAGMSATLARRAQAMAALADALDPPAARQPAAARAGAGDPGAAAEAALDGGAGGGADGGAGAGAGGGAGAAGAPGKQVALGGAPGQSGEPGAGAVVAADAPSGATAGTSTPGAARTGTVAPADAEPVDAPSGRGPAALPALGAVAGLLIPSQAAGGVVRDLGRVTAAAGRGLESLAGTPGAASPVVAGVGQTQSVPEPGSLWLALLGLVVLATARWRGR